MKSVMTHSFSQVPRADIPRSQFNRSHGYKTTFNAGRLIPFLVDEALPGDTFKLNASLFGRLNTPIVPIMDNMFLDTFFFAVPYRLVWDNWQKMNGEQIDPGDSTDYLVPQMEAPSGTGYTVGHTQDYMGLPTYVDGFSHSALPLRAYRLIWNEWFRDQNLQESLVIDRGDGPDASGPTIVPLRRNKRHDYFTSCLPWPQKGPAVTLPLGETAPLERIPNAPFSNAYNTGTDTLASNATLQTVSGGLTTGGSTAISIDNSNAMRVDLSAATAATVNALRQAFQIQKLYERDARGGTRYTEIIRSHFGVVSPDARLQRPEYLGGGSTPINIHPIAQTSASDETTPQGNLAAMGTVSASGHGFTKSFTEHCIIIGLVSVRADLNYQNGLDRMWTRRSRWDFYWPALSHIGEQAVLNKEIRTLGDSTDDEVFGYQERYAEYRYKNSKVTGLFKSNAPQSLDIWHLAQDFTDSLDFGLNSGFIEEDPPIDRIVAVPSEPHFKLDCYFDMKCARPMPTYSVPGLIDHF